MAEIAKPIRVGNVWTNLISGTTGENVNYEEVTEWFDGTPMDDSKVDGEVYRKLPSSVGGGYVIKVYPDFGEVFLEKDTMSELRNLNQTEILLLKTGRYRGVTLSGYYAKNDTPSPINYYLSDTEELDDGGSVIEVGGIKLEHIFVDRNNTLYFGLSTSLALTPLQKRIIIQNAFEASKTQGTPITIISAGEHIIESPGLNYNVNNSTLIFEGSLKLKDNDSVLGDLTGCRLIAYTGYNIEVINQKLDGNRDNQEHNTQIGTQFNFTYYTYAIGGGIVFRGGWSINAIQSHCQFIASTVEFKDYRMENCGEHGIYYSLAVGGQPGKLLKLDNVKIINHGIISGGASLSIRAVRKGVYTNCVFDSGITPKGGQVNNAAIFYSYRGVILSEGEEFLHKFINCNFHRSPTSIYTVGCRITEDDILTVDEHVALNRGIIIEGGLSDYTTGSGVLKAVNHIMDLVIGNKFTHNELPREIINSQIKNLYRYWPESNKNLTIINTHIINSDPEIRDLFNSNMATPGEDCRWLFFNNLFEGFDTQGGARINIVRASNPNNYIPVVISNNSYIKSPSANIISSGGNPNITITNNNDLDNSQVTFNVSPDVVPKMINNNNFVVEEGPISARPNDNTRHVGMRYFNTQGPNYQMWTGSSWINTSPPNATVSIKGLVNQGVAVPNGASIDTLLTSLRNAGIIAT